MEVVPEDLPLFGEAVVDTNNIVAHGDRLVRGAEVVSVGQVGLGDHAGVEVGDRIRVDQRSRDNIAGKVGSWDEAGSGKLGVEGRISDGWHDELDWGGVECRGDVVKILTGHGKISRCERG